MLQLFRAFRGRAYFRAGDDASFCFSGPAELEGIYSSPVSAVWFLWNITAHPLLGEIDSISLPHWLGTAGRIAVQEKDKSTPDTQRSRLSLNDPPLCYSFTLLVVLASSTSGDL
jgi:hypothetical protein